MFIRTESPWFKVCAAITAALTSWFSAGAAVHSQVAAESRLAATRLETAAQNLGVDPDRIRTGSTREAREAAETAKRRADALARLRARTQPDPERLRAAATLRAAIEEKGRPALLAGLARSSEDAGAVAASMRAGQRNERASARLEADRRAIARAVKSANAGGEGRLAASLSRVRQLEAALRSASTSGRTTQDKAADIERLSPPSRHSVPPGRASPHDPPARPPEPRSAVRMGHAASTGQRALYASLLGAPGLEVETRLGDGDPLKLALGLPLWAPLLAYGVAGTASGLLAALTPGLTPPGSEDLAETSEARLSPEIRALATRLGNDPLAIYNYVHDETDAEPYYGAKKGASGALAELSGNDADLAALLVALLRAAGRPARYEYGTVDLTPEQAMAWAGTTTVYQAANVLRTGGIPTKIILLDGRPKSVRVEHVWVRAWVPYSNYRGKERAGSKSIWVRLDPTIKRATLSKALDARGKVAFDSAAFLAGPVASMPLDFFEARLREWTASAGLACKSLDELVPARQRVSDRLTALPAELPSRVLSSLATFSGIPASLRHSASITLGTSVYGLDLPSQYAASVTLRYRGATATDIAAIRDAGGITGLSRPYEVQVVPVLTIDGVDEGPGSPLMPGEPQTIAVRVTTPNAGSQVENHNVFAGGVYAMAFPVGVVPGAQLAAREAAYQRAVATGTGGDDLEAARVELTLWRYFSNLHRDVKRSLGLHWFQSIVGVSEGIAGAHVDADLLYGVPVSIRRGKWVIDIPRGGWTPYSVDGNDAQLVPASTLAQWQGSAWEHRVWEQAFGSPAISTVRVFQAARSQGVGILRIDGSNVATVAGLPYSAGARTDIVNAVHAGQVATLPERPISWGDYPSSEGWILQDPLTGTGAFRIDEAANGGASKGPLRASSGTASCRCSGTDEDAESRVSLSMGNMYFAETDVSLPARGIPISFARSYDSMSPYGGRLGPGWQHSWELRLVAQPNGDLLFVNDGLRTQRFVKGADGTFTAEPGYHERLAPLPDGWAVTLKDGTEYRFRPDGQLRSIQTLNDHLVQLRYDASDRLEAVLDATMRRALTFAYDDAGLLSSVTAVDGRTVSFAHDAGDLVAVTDVLGATQEFGYDGAHRLAWKKDKLGNVVYEFYDGEGRWIGGEDPAGYGRRVAYDMMNRRAVHIDKNGYAKIYEYNERGNPLSVTDPLGNRRTMEWNERQEKLAEVDARGNRTAMTYDADGNMLSRTDPLGASVSWTYDARGRVLTTSDAAGTVTNVYDARGNLSSSTDAAGATTLYGYTADGLPETITQPGRAITTLAYYADGSVQSISDAEGGITKLGYDAFGHLSTIEDALQHVRKMEADAAGRIQWMEDAAGARTTFGYDAQGNRTSVMDAAQSATAFAYDALHRLVTVTDAAGKVTRSEYDPEGQVTARVDALGKRTEYRYDEAGRLVETVDATGSVTSQGYCADVGAQACAVVDALGNLTSVELDALGRPTAVTDANGGRTEEHYDALGRRDWSKDAAGRVTSYGYDLAGRLKSVVDSLGGTTGYGYDERGNRTVVTDARGAVTTFAYDLANRLLSETNPIGGVTSYEYDAAGNRRFKVDGNGNRTEYVYDANRRLKKVLFADGTSYDFDYDARGNRTLEQSPTHRRDLAYDALGRLETVVDGGVGRTITYGYDAVGNRTSMSLDTGEQVRYRWDAMGRLSEVQDPQGDVTRYRYDAAGRRSRVDYGNRTAAEYVHDALGQVQFLVYTNQAGDVLEGFGYAYDAAGNRTHKALATGGREQYGYDSLNRLTSVDYPSGRHVEYGYDAVGNRKSLVDTTKSVKRYPVSARASSQYRSTGQGSASAAVGPPDVAACANNTVSANHWYADFEGFYTAREEWLELTYAAAERAQGVWVHETSGSGVVMSIDLIEENGTAHTVYEGGDKTECGGWLRAAFPLTSYAAKKVKVVTKYLGGEGIDSVALETPAPETYQYNWFNQLVGVTAPDGGAPTTFAYDGNGNQVSKSDRLGTTTYAYNLDNRLVGIAAPGGVTSSYEYDANGLRTKKSDSTGTRSYLLDGLSIVAEYAPDASRLAWYTQSLARIDEVLNVVNGQGKYWYEADALGSTYAMTSTAGAVVSRSSYDVFGERALVSANDVVQPFGFTGREQDRSGLVYARARYLQPHSGTWNRRDPMRQIDEELPYSYVGGAPTSFVDPLGLFKEGIHDFIISRAVRMEGGSASDIPVLQAASAEADGPLYQLPGFASRHGMRESGETLEQGLRSWTTFVAYQLAQAAVLATRPLSTTGCRPRTLDERAAMALRELGMGMHAVMDFRSPFHMIGVWAYDASGLLHVQIEGGIPTNSVLVVAAIQDSRRYYRAFKKMQTIPLGDPMAWAIYLYAYEARLSAIEALTVEQP